MSGDSLLSKLGLAVLGQALPSASALDGYMAHARQSIIYSIVAGIMFSGLLLASVYGGYMLLLSEGISQSTAITITLLVALLIAIICMQRAASLSKRAAQIKNELNLFKAEAGSSLLEESVLAFINGLREEPNTRDKQDTSVQSVILVKD